MSNDWVKSQHEYMLELGANIFSTGTYDITRPNYSSPTSTSTKVALNQIYRIERLSSYAVEPNVSGLEYYGIYGKRQYQSGDIITMNPSDGDFPVITVIMSSQKKDSYGFRTNRRGKLTKAKDDTKYTNVRFDFLASVPSVGQPDFPEMDGSLHHQAAKAAIWFREDIGIGNRLIDELSGDIFSIIDIAVLGKIMTLTLEESRY